MRIRIILISLIALSLSLQANSQQTGTPYSGEKFNSLDSGIEKNVTVTVIYDNYIKEEGTQADWGYSILIEGTAKTILFDTGTKPGVFKNNFSKLEIDPAVVDEVFISHEHGDHFGGLHDFLSMNKDVKVVVPYTFTKSFLDEYSDECNAIETIDAPAQICRHMYSTGVLGESIPEQALVLNTKKGLVVMTGCSHPGITDMIEDIKSTFKSNVYMVFGGFHLMDRSDEEINKIINSIKSLGVVKCGATHCTGERQIELFRNAFGKNFVEMGVGNTIVIE